MDRSRFDLWLKWPMLLGAAAALQTAGSGAQAAPAAYKPPNLNPTQVPSAYVAEWGNYFLSSSIYTYEKDGASSAFTTDGSATVGLGLGNSKRLLALEMDLNQDSFANSNNGGSLDIRLSRQLIARDRFALQLGAGWLGLASYGTWPKPGGSPYGVLTAAWPLRPHDDRFRQILQINLGGGSGRFQTIDAARLIGDGAIASVGVELAPNVGVSAGWAGKGLNASLSYVPLRATPLFLALSGANLTNSDGTGRAVAFTLSWGGNFRTATFPP